MLKIQPSFGELNITKVEHSTSGAMSRQGSRGSAGDYQADEQAGVARVSWRL